jgi:protein TonB
MDEELREETMSDTALQGVLSQWKGREAVSRRPQLIPAGDAPVAFSPLLAAPGKKGKLSTLVTSMIVHTLSVTVLVLIPLIYTEAIDLKGFSNTWLEAPPPPPPPPPPAAQQPVARARRPTLMNHQGQLKAPATIPKEIAQIVEEPIAADSFGSGIGVPGGVPGGAVGGVLGGVLGGVPQVAPPPPAADVPPGPMRAGSALKPPRLIQHVPPSYPAVASRARIFGDVRLDALIGTDGRVYDLKVISGHPMLVQAATDAVRQWRYEPTLLNGRPVEVLLEVVVHFQLN